METITISTAWVWFLGACAAIVTISKAWEIVKPKGNFKSVIDKHSAQLDNDLKRIKALEDGQIITMQTLLALTRHAIDGNNIQDLKLIRDKLQDYLIHR